MLLHHHKRPIGSLLALLLTSSPASAFVHTTRTTSSLTSSGLSSSSSSSRSVTFGIKNDSRNRGRDIHKISSSRLSSGTSSTEQTLFEKVLADPKFPPEWPFTDADFSRQDESRDSDFYESPRLCYHIDDAAVAALTKYYGEQFKDGEDVLDICSSWVSHYPPDWKGGNVVGLGMNKYELSQNKQLSSYVTKDLNVDPTFPFEDESFDRVTCVVSVDYLNKPKEVFKEIGRVLRPGGVCMLSISNRCFPTKAFRIWLQTNDYEHVFIAGSFFYYSGLFDMPKCDDISPNPKMSDPLFIVRAAKKSL